MFGGLDIKRDSSSNNNKNNTADAGKTKDDNNNVSPPAAMAPTSSAFSFLNPISSSSNATTHTAAMTEHTTAVTSAFSFLTLGTESNAAATVPSVMPVPTTATMSSFSFLQPTKSLDEKDNATTMDANHNSLADAATLPSPSSFSFLTSPLTPPAPITHDDAPSAPEATSPMSVFSFLNSPTPITPVEAPSSTATTTTAPSSSLLATVQTTHTDDDRPGLSSSTTTTTTTATSSSPALSNWEDHLVTANPSIPAGSGVVFGGAVTFEATSKKPIKKRNRVTRVGVGAAASGFPPSPPKASPITATTTTTTTSSSSNPSQSMAQPSHDNIEQDGTTPSRSTTHREEAEEAAWRAEQFLREKMMETTAKSVAATMEQQSSNNNNAVEFTRTKSASSYRSDQYEGDLDDEDDVVAAAKAAAEEARQLSSSSLSSSSSLRQRSLGDRLGGLFQRKAWTPNTTVGAPSLIPSTSSHSWLATGGLKSSSETSSSGELTAVERIQREQEEIKRAMAERQLVMQQFHAQHQQQQQQSQYHSYPPKPSTADDHDDSAVMTETLAPATREFVPPPEPPVVQQQPPAPPPPKAPTDLFDEIMSEFHSQVQKAMDRVGQLRQQRGMLLEERFVTLAKERLASQQMAQAEAQQQAAAEAEDFDLADQMGTVLEAHARERGELDSILVSIGRALEQLETQRVQVVGAVAECFADVRSKLKKFEKEQHNKESKDDTESMRKFSTVAKQLSAENERLQQDLKHLERDETLVAEERKELETAISEHSGEHEVQRNEAVEKLHHVEEEIEELRKRLAAKEAVAEELRSEIRSQDEAIGKIRVKFSRQLLRVQTKESTLKENRQEWENEKATFERQKDAHETEVGEHSQSLLKHEELMSKLKNEISLAGTFERIVSKEVGFDELLKDNEETDGDLAQMHSEVVKCEAAVSKANDVLKAVNATLSALEEEHKKLIELIPELESEKKSAAARRDFKAASKASKEIKDATIRLKECLQELTCEAADRKIAAEEELKKMQAELEEKRKTTQEKEKVSGDAAMLVLAQKIKDLIATKRSICGNAAGTSIQGIGRLVLDGQIDSLKMEGQTLGSKYGGWDELLADIEAAENAEAQEVDAVAAKEAAKDYGDLDADPSGSDTTCADEETTDAQGDPEREPVSKLTSEEKIAKFKELTSQLKDAEESLEAAVAKEEYEEAAELEDVFQQIQKALETLDLTDEEMDIAMGDDDPELANATTSAGNEPSGEEVDVAKGGDDANKGTTSAENEPSREQNDDAQEEKADECATEETEDEKIMEETEDHNEATPEQEPDENDDEQANGDSKVPHDSNEQNGGLKHDAKTEDDEDDLPQDSAKGNVADHETDAVQSTEIDDADMAEGYSQIQDSEIGAQSEC